MKTKVFLKKFNIFIKNRYLKVISIMLIFAILFQFGIIPQQVKAATTGTYAYWDENAASTNWYSMATLPKRTGQNYYLALKTDYPYARIIALYYDKNGNFITGNTTGWCSSSSINFDSFWYNTSVYRVGFEALYSNSADGSSSKEVDSNWYYIDNEKPTVTFNQPSSSWVKSATVTITPSDIGSGIEHTMYRISSDGGNTWGSWSLNGGGGSLTGTFSTTGKYVFQAYSFDYAGNCSETVTSGTYLVDSTPPTVSFSPNSASWSKSVPVTITPSDSQSGVYSYTYYYSTNNGNTWNFIGGQTGNNPTTLSLNVTGNYKFGVNISDNAGNTAEIQSGQYLIDTIAPTLNVIHSTGTWEKSDAFNVTASDSNSGIALQKYAIGTLPSSFFANNGTIFTGSNVNVTQNGTYTFYTKDNAGNETTYTADESNIYTAPKIGRYTQSFSDLNVKSTGMSALFGRIYDSSNTDNGPFGPGWTFSYQGSCKDYQYSYTDANGATQTASMSNLKVVELPDGSKYTFRLENGVYTAYDTRDTLTKNSNGTFTYKTTDKTTYTFNASGYLISIKDKNGNTQTITVDSNGNVTSVKDTAGRTYTVSYSNGKISSITDPMNRTVSYGYTNGYLTSVTDPMGRTSHYSYTNNLLTSETDALSNTTEAVTYDTQNRVTSDTNAAGEKTTYSYDDTANTVTTTDKDGTSTETYDSMNLLSSMTGTDGTVTKYNQYGDTLSSGSETYAYDSNGNLISTTYSDGTKDTCTYDSSGNLTNETKADGTSTSCSYDTNGNLLQKSVTSNATTTTTSYVYNSNGTLNKETDSDGTVTTYTYDSYGDVLTQSSVKGTVTDSATSTYNTIGWTTGTVSTTTDSSNNSSSSTTVTYVYENDGQVVRQTDGSNTTRYVYDGAGRLTQKVNPDEYVSADDGLNKTTPDYTYSDSTVGYKYTYSGGSTTVATETMPNSEVLTYNSDGKVTAVSNPANGAAVSNISYTYDDNDNIKTISENGVQKVSYTYDSSNELTREDNVWQNETITYTYDTNGNIESKTVYPYTTGDLSSVMATSTVPYTYGNTSDTSQLTIYNGKSISYDTNGNMTGCDGWTYTWSGKNLSGSSKTGSTVSYSYNSDGIRTSKTVNGTTTYTLNDNVIKSQTDGTNTISYTYDDESNPLTMTLNGTKYTYEKNAQGDITGLIDSNGNEVVTYSYDSWGKLLNIGGTLASTVGTINPLRYRGYYYDSEAGMYYLQSRYYNPEIGRFISKDDQSYHEDMTGAAANLYAYCNNNPVMNVDTDGNYGRTAAYRYWWGYRIYLSRSKANDLVWHLNRECIIAGAAGTICGFSCNPIGIGVAIGCVVGIVWVQWLVNDINHCNSRRGVIIDITWWLTFNVWRQ